MKTLPHGFNSAFQSRHLCHLPWHPVNGPEPLPMERIVLVRGTTGMMAPKNEFIALGIYDDQYHPKANDHWFDMNNDYFTDCGWEVTAWCEL